MSTALTGDFFAADEGRKPAVLLRPIAYAPGDEPNPRNPGGISDNEVKRRKNAELAKVNAAKAAATKKAAAAKAAKQIEADQNAALAAAKKRSGGIVGDLKAIGKGVATGVADVAKVTGTVVALVPGGQVLGGAILAGGAALGAAVKGDIKGAVVAGATAAAPALGGLANAAAPVVKAAATVVHTAAPVVKAIQASGVVDTLAKGANVSAATLVPAFAGVTTLVYDAGNVDGLRVVVDKLLAAAKQPGSVGTQAAKILGDTAGLAFVSNPMRADAAKVVAIISEVTNARAAEKIAAGAERAVTAAGAKAAAQYLATSLGIKPALAAGVTVRAEQPADAFAGVRSSLAPKASTTTKAPSSVFLSVDLPAAAPVVARAPVVATLPPKPAAAAPSSAPVVVTAPPSIGFVVTADARILDGTRWLEDPSGAAGTFVLASGPIALRREDAVRYWKRA
jgi:hypothetical protein